MLRGGPSCAPAEGSLARGWPRAPRLRVFSCEGRGPSRSPRLRAPNSTLQSRLAFARYDDVLAAPHLVLTADSHGNHLIFFPDSRNAWMSCSMVFRISMLFCGNFFVARLKVSSSYAWSNASVSRPWARCSKCKRSWLFPRFGGVGLVARFATGYFSLVSEYIANQAGNDSANLRFFRLRRRNLRWRESCRSSPSNRCRAPDSDG